MEKERTSIGFNSWVEAGLAAANKVFWRNMISGPILHTERRNWWWKKIELECLLLENTWHSYQIFSLEKVINFFSQRCFELSLLRIACHPREVLLHWTMVLLYLDKIMGVTNRKLLWCRSHCVNPSNTWHNKAFNVEYKVLYITMTTEHNRPLFICVWVNNICLVRGTPQNNKWGSLFS